MNSSVLPRPFETTPDRGALALLFSRNRCAQVFKTYALRPRFWLLVPPYLITPPFVSACVAALLACFLALHMRRQFGTAAAKLVPGFAGPHLIVAGLVSLTVWAGVPTLQAWRFGLRIESVVAIHAIAGLLLALVVIWPRAIVLIVLAPVSVAWIVSNVDRRPAEWLERFASVGDPWVSVPLIALTLVAHGVAGWFLLRLTDQSAVLDDLASDAPRFEGAAGRVEAWLLDRRDAVVTRQLSQVGTGLWAILRWRIPVALSWTQLALYPLTVAAILLPTLRSTSDPGIVILVLVATNSVFAFAPFANWRGRRHWMAAEVTRPVTRDQYFCETAVALAWDIVLWFSMMGIAAGFVVGFLSPPVDDRTVLAVGAYLAVLLGLAVFLFGLGLLTMRWSYWFAILVLSTIVWSFVSVWSLAVLLAAVKLLMPLPLLLPILWAVVSALVGLKLIQVARRKWSEADLA